jgi:DNA N-6-adenine-methyltransferase (Dam)
MSNDNWRTPNTADAPIFDICREIFGDGIDVDCAADDAWSTPCGYHVTKEMDFLGNSWMDYHPPHRAAFLNPPFSNPKPFLERLASLYFYRYFDEAIAVLRSGCLHNKGTGPIIYRSAAAICLWGAGKAPRRISFLDEFGNPGKNGADFDCVLVYWGHKKHRAKQVFDKHGKGLYL